MSYAIEIANILVLVIGVVMVAKHHKQGWNIPPVLSGIAFILIGLSSLVTVFY